MMLEDILINYGVLGLWTIYLLYEKKTLLAGLSKNLKENSKVLEELKNHFQKS